METITIGHTGQSMPRASDFKSINPVPQFQPAVSAPVQTVHAVQQAASAPGLEQVKQAVDSINESMQSLAQGLEFSIDEESERIVVKVIDPESKEVIRQIPSDEALAIAKSLDQVIGRLIKEVA